MTVLAGESQSLMFNLTTGMKLTNVSLSTIAPFPVEVEPNSVTEIPAMGSWSFEVTVSVPSEMPLGTYSVDVLLTTDEVPPDSYIPLSISVNAPTIKMADITLDIGKVHFPGELAQLHILLAHEGALINVTDFDQVTLWYKTVDGTYHSVNLNASVEPIDLGLYGVPFEVPAEAVSCALVVRVETYVEEMNAVCKGV